MIESRSEQEVLIIHFCCDSRVQKLSPNVHVAFPSRLLLQKKWHLYLKKIAGCVTSLENPILGIPFMVPILNTLAGSLHLLATNY